MEIEIVSYVNSGLGRQYPARRDFQWATDVVHMSGSKRTSQRNQLFAQPVRHYYINYQALTETEKNRLLELFNRAHAQYGTLLIKDDEDYTCTLADCSITAVADQVEFQLVKTYYNGETEEWTEDKKKIMSSGTFPPVVKVDGVTKTEGVDFTLDDTTGIVDFTLMGAPGAGAVITANYQFYYQVRFTFDTYIDKRDIPNYWQYEGIHLVEDE